MAINKVVFGNDTLIDLTNDTVASNVLLNGITAHGSNGESISGTIVTRSSSDVTRSGPTISVSSGYYATAVSTVIPDANMKTSANLTRNPNINVSSSGLITATLTSSTQTQTQLVNYGGAGYVSSLPFLMTVSGSSSYQLPVKSSSDLSTSGAVVTVPSGYYASSANTTLPSGIFEPDIHSVTLSIDSITLDSHTGLISISEADSSWPLTAFAAESGYIEYLSRKTVQGALQISISSASYQLSTQSAITITPTESQQVAVSGGKFTTGAVTVAAISSDYIGSNIATRSAVDVTVSGPTVSIPSGYYAADANASIPSGTLTNSGIQIGGGVGIVSFNSATGDFVVSRNQAYYPLTVTITEAGYFAEGSIQTGYFQINAASTSYQLSTQSAATYTPSSATQTIPSGIYLTGVQTIKGDANLVAANIAEGVTIFGIQGTHHGGGNLQSKSVTPSSASQVVTYDSGYDGLSTVTVEAIPISVVSHRLVLPEGLIGV